jgi:hypothetical protein
LEGIAAAKARGVYTGRKSQIDPAPCGSCANRRSLDRARSPNAGIGRASVYRVLGKEAAYRYADPPRIPPAVSA